MPDTYFIEIDKRNADLISRALRAAHQNLFMLKIQGKSYWKETDELELHLLADMLKPSAMISGSTALNRISL